MNKITFQERLNLGCSYMNIVVYPLLVYWVIINNAPSIIIFVYVILYFIFTILSLKELQNTKHKISTKFIKLIK
jgi:ABC-type nitrate/sulfonate/bicarbonate transport system permease component